MNRLEILSNMGFETDPFQISFETADQKRVKRILNMATASGAMISIVGERGIGKTEAVNAALSGRIRKIMPYATDKPRLSIGDIEQAMILDLSDESPKRSKELRIRQLRRILGEASRHQKLVLVLEEGHRLHPGTLRALKTLRELDWMGKRNLFAAVLVCQSDPMNRPGVSEVRLRSDTVTMSGLTPDEVIAYLDRTVGGYLENTAAEYLKTLPVSRNFLELQEAVISAMSRALMKGRKTVSAEELDGGRPTELPTVPAKAGNNVLKSILDRRKTEEKNEETQLKKAV